MKLRKNALLTIENVYENMHAKFNKNRKRALKKASSLGFTFEENIAANEFYDFYVLNDKNHRTHVSMKKVLQNILNLKTQAVQCYGIKRNTVLIAGVLLLVDPKRITYLIPVASAFGKKNAAATLLVDEIIKKYRHSHQILDFEGSMIPGVAKFYESFGATYEDYPTFSKNFI
jgi:site-specific DNA-cytosine methylase